jgi:D-amino-acid dehydrogenase
MSGRRRDIVVVGGGPVGACAAQALAAAGAAVTLLERESEVAPAACGAYANCGLVNPSHCVPLASPGALGHGLKWLLDADSPFFIAPRPSPSLARWLWMFRAASTAERVEAAMPVMRALHVASAGRHDELARDGGDGWLYHRNGIVQVYEAESHLAEAVTELELLAKVGVPADVIPAAEARSRFPGIVAPLSGALWFPEDAHLDPALFTRAMAAKAARDGAEVRTGAEVFALEPDPAGVRVLTTAGDLVAEQVVLAAGAWTPSLTAALGLPLPIEPAKGYSVDVARPAGFPETALYLGDAWTVLTPLGDRLRLGSSLELAGWDMRIRRNRVRRLRVAAERAMGIPADGPVERVWRGPRPVTPDGLPIIGRVPRRERVIVAGGHCMLGLSLGPVTGTLVAEIAGGRRPSLDLAPLSPTRFS